MPNTTPKGVPYSLGLDAVATIDETMQTLAEWVDARPGIAPLSTAQRDALAGVELWDGRIIWNLTLGQLERYSVGSVKWLPIFNIGNTYRDTYSFTLQGDVRVDNVAGDYHVNPFFVEVPTGQTTVLRAVNFRLRSGSAQFALDRRTAAGAVTRIGTYSVVADYGRSTTGFPVTLANLDTIHLVVLSSSAGKHLTASIAYDMTV